MGLLDEDEEQQRAILEWAIKKSERRMAAWLDVLKSEEDRRAWVVRMWKRFKVWILERI